MVGDDELDALLAECDGALAAWAAGRDPPRATVTASICTELLGTRDGKLRLWREPVER